jgi:epoxide hydrolase 4
MSPTRLSDLSEIIEGNFCNGAAISSTQAERIKLHYVTCGDPSRPLMLLMHGFPEFWRAYEGVIQRLAEHFYVVAPDLRGFNLSDKPPGIESYKAALIIADMMALVAHVGAKTFVLVAHDWGGAIAWNMALAYPAKISKLVILNAPHPVPFAKALATDQAQQDASQYMNWLRAPGCEAMLAENDYKRMSDFFETMAAPGTSNQWFSGKTKKDYLAAWREPGALTGGANYYRSSPLYPPTDDDIGAKRLSLDPDKFTVKIPTKIIWGEADVALLPVLLNDIETLVPGVELERWPDASHWLLHEFPERCIASILAFTQPLVPGAERLRQKALRYSGPSLPEMGVIGAREFFEQASKALDIQAIALPLVDDWEVTLNDRRLILRRYASRLHPSNAPTLFYFHGGGFTIGSISTHDSLCRTLASRSGCVVLSLEYRLAPEFTFPAAFDDAWESLLWVRDNAIKLGINLNKIVLGGDSAGGTLAAATAIAARDQGLHLAGQILIYPGLAAKPDTASQQFFSKGYTLDREVIEWFLHTNYCPTLANRSDWRFAPLLAPNLQGLAPAWICTASHDPLRDEGHAYANRLTNAGVPTVYRQYNGLLHNFMLHGALIPEVLLAHQDVADAINNFVANS